eukprot:407866_1
MTVPHAAQNSINTSPILSPKMIATLIISMLLAILMHVLAMKQATKANPIWADGVLTCLSKQNNGTSGSIIDYVFTNDLSTIDSLKIDTHPVYSDHRPVIFASNGIDVS